MMYVNSDPRYQYFSYKNVYYKTGTKVIFIDKVIKNNIFNGKLGWKYAYFSHRFIEDGKNKFKFIPANINWSNRLKYSPYIVLDETQLEEMIESITEPIIIQTVPAESKIDFEVSAVLIGWTIYIAVMGVSLIFNDFYIIWIIATFIFFRWRRKKLRE